MYRRRTASKSAYKAPYKKKSYSRSYPKSTSRYFSANPSTYTKGSSSMINREYKYKDASHSLSIPAHTGNDERGTNCQIESFNLIGVGNGPSGRIGRKIVVKQIEANIICHMASHEGDTVRFSLVQDMQCNGAYPKSKEIWTGSDLVQFHKLETSRRFKILKQKVVTFDLPSLATKKLQTGVENIDLVPAEFQNSEATKYVTLKYRGNIEVLYDGANPDGSIADVKSNNLLLVCQSHKGVSKIIARMRATYAD